MKKLCTVQLKIYLYILIFVSCQSQPDYVQPPEQNTQLAALIEIPCGTSVQKSGKKQQTSNHPFLPYIANFGQITGTFIDSADGGKGESLGVYVLAEPLRQNEKINILPIATIIVRENDKVTSKIIAIPSDPKKQIINVKDYISLSVKHNSVKNILQEWIINHKGMGKIEFLSWQNERYALDEIRRWQDL